MNRRTLALRTGAVAAAALSLAGCASTPARHGATAAAAASAPAAVAVPSPVPSPVASAAAVAGAPRPRAAARPVVPHRVATPQHPTPQHPTTTRLRATVAPTHAVTKRPARPVTHPRTVSASPVDRLRGVGTARQVVVVQAGGYGTSYATLTAYQKTASGWVRRFGPWSARIGRNGFAPSGQKREGDGRTPTGSYGFSFFFGVEAAPSGIHYAWRHAFSYDVWDDDPHSARYNLWTDERTQAAGRSPEPMHNQPSYNAAAVIAYNTARTPGLGSAIFFHVSHGSSTAGCVAIPQADLIPVLRWLNPAYGPRIIMGTTAATTR